MLLRGTVVRRVDQADSAALCVLALQSAVARSKPIAMNCDGPVDTCPGTPLHPGVDVPAVSVACVLVMCTLVLTNRMHMSGSCGW